MRISKVISFLTSIIVALFGFFPGSERISELYSVTYDWTPVLDAVSDAVKSSDSQALASMASPEMKKKFPDMKERLDAMFADIEGDVITNVRFLGGCNGNLKAISKLVDGYTVEQIEEKLKGNTCGMRPTSCADQLSIAVREAYEASK